MTKFLIISAFVFLGANAITAQTTETRTVAPFKQVEISGGAEVVYTQNDSLSLKIEGNEREIANIFTNTENGILIIKPKGVFTHTYKIFIQSKELTRIDANGASKFKNTGSISCDSLSVNLSGASSANINLQARSIDGLVNGASTLLLEGTCRSLYTTVTGAGELKAFKLKTNNALINTSGASNAKVSVSDKIQASATGSSSIKFKGDPKDVSVEASTASTITKILEEDGNKKSSDKKDSTEFDFKNRKFIIINKDKEKDNNSITYNQNEFHHWAGLAIGVNGLLSNGNINLPSNQKYMQLDYGKSIDFQFNLFEKNIHIYKNYVNLVTGIGFDWHQYEFRNKTKLNPDSSYTYGIIDSTNTFSYKKNRLKTSFIQVPLLLEFNTNKNPKKAFHLAFGVIGGYKLGSKTKQIIEKNGNSITSIKRDNYNINPFRLDAYASIGYHNLTLFANYGLTPLFESGRGPELTPFTIGVKLLSW